MEVAVAEPAVKSVRKSRKPPPRAKFVGPLFGWELVRLARRGQDARARFILAFSLFLVLTAFSLVWFRNTSPVELFFGDSQVLKVSESALFGESFSLTFVLAQMGILTLLTPAYAAGGIAEEKDRRTLIFLLVSDLTAREIVFGKFLGRVTFLMGILFAGLPILAITQLHGGVSFNYLLMSYLITASTVFLLAGISAASAAAAETLRGALFRAYGLTAIVVVTGFGIFVFLSPFAVILFVFKLEANSPDMFWIVSIGYSLIEIILGGVGVLLAVRSIRNLRSRLTYGSAAPPRWMRERYRRDDLRKLQHEQMKAAQLAQKQSETELGIAFPELTEGIAEATDGDAPAKPIPIAPVSRYSSVRPIRGRVIEPRRDPRRRPPVRYDSQPEIAIRPRIGLQDPFLWKERYTQGTKRTEDDDAMKSMMYLLGGVLALIVVFFLGISVLSILGGNGQDASFRTAKSLLLVAGGAGAFTHLLTMGTSACGTICRERQRLTLESLLTIPVPRRDILVPKWMICLNRGWWWGVPSACILACAFATTDEPALFFLALPFVLGAMPFACSYGIWLSIRCRSVNRAVMWFLPAAGFLVLFPIAVCSWVSKTNAGILGPIMGIVLMLMLGAAYAFWTLSEKAFDRETIL